MSKRVSSTLIELICKHPDLYNAPFALASMLREHCSNPEDGSAVDLVARTAALNIQAHLSQGEHECVLWLREHEIPSPQAEWVAELWMKAHAASRPPSEKVSLQPPILMQATPCETKVSCMIPSPTKRGFSNPKIWRMGLALTGGLVLLGAIAIPVGRSAMVTHAKRLMADNPNGYNADVQKWLLPAEKLGSSEAMYLLARMTDQEDHPNVTPEVVARYSKAADKGHPSAMARLGFLSLNGQGVAKDVSKAAKLAQEAAAKGNSDGITLLAVLYMKGAGMESNMPKAIELHKKAAMQGSRASMLALQGLYSTGFPGVLERSDAEALRYLKMLAEAGDPNGLRQLAYKYLGNEDIPKDLVEYRTLILQSAKKQDGLAQVSLGSDLLYGDHGFQRKPEEGLQWIRTAADRGFTYAQMRLSYLYSQGDFVPKDTKMAVQWLTKAAEAGDKDAQVELGVAYRDGREGFGKDFEKAKFWLSSAVAAGGNNAPEALAHLEGLIQQEETPVRLINLNVVIGRYGYPRIQGHVNNTSKTVIDAMVVFDLIAPSGVILDHYEKPLWQIPSGGTCQIDIAIDPRYQDARVQVRDLKWRIQ